MKWSLVCCGGAVVFLVVASCWGAEESGALKQYRLERRQLAERPFRLIINNDGGDAILFPKDQEFTDDAFLDRRTTKLIGSDVTTLSYCPMTCGFSCFTQRTKIGTTLLNSYEEKHERLRPGRSKTCKNVTLDMVNRGYDPLDVIIEFGNKHAMEIFWSFRMNDTHDSEHRPDAPFLQFPPLKEQHPELLFGRMGEKLPHGRWSAVDYSHKIITDLAWGVTDEVCRERDVTGIELDFCRHLYYFKSVAQGKTATPEQCEVITNLLRRIRETSEREGMRRGKPILVVVRTPDDANYCKAIGLNIETWMNENLADIYIGSDYFQFHPRKDWAALGKKHNTVMYAGLAESRVMSTNTRFSRRSNEAYNARIAEAWGNGLSGVYLFNIDDAPSEWWNGCTDPNAMRTKDKHYFHTTLEGTPNNYLRNGERFRSLTLITPKYPLALTADTPAEATLYLAERKEDLPHRVITACCLLDTVPTTAPLTLRVNGKEVAGGKIVDGWGDFRLPVSVLRQGDNRFEFRMTSGKAKLVDFVVTAGNKP